MEAYVFTATLYPQIEDWSLKSECTLSTDDIEEVIFSASFHNSEVVVEAMSHKSVDIYSLRNLVEEFCKTTIDALGYLEGFPIKVVMSRTVNHNGNEVLLAAGPMVLIDSRLERPFADQYEKMLTIAGESFYLRAALSNLREGMLATSDTGLFCFRAIESMRQSFHTKDPDKKESSRKKEQTWKRLAQALKIDMSWFDDIRPFSEFQRHGAPKFMSSETRAILLLRTAQTIDRFCLYLTKDPILERLSTLSCNGSSEASMCIDPAYHSTQKHSELDCDDE